MKLKNYSNFFLKRALPKALITKKLNSTIKAYVCGSRAHGHIILDYNAYLSLFRKIILFIQASTRAKTPFVFFFENISFSFLYKDLANSCNEHICLIPKTYNWVANWNPNKILILNQLNYSVLPTVIKAGIALFSTPISYPQLLNKLVSNNWPIILPISSSAEDVPSTSYRFKKDIYILPGTSILSVSQQYFYASLLAKTIYEEKLRQLQN